MLINFLNGRLCKRSMLAQLLWYYQIALLDKLKTQSERYWYAKRTLEQLVS